MSSLLRATSIFSRLPSKRVLTKSAPTFPSPLVRQVAVNSVSLYLCRDKFVFTPLSLSSFSSMSSSSPTTPSPDQQVGSASGVKRPLSEVAASSSVPSSATVAADIPAHEVKDGPNAADKADGEGTKKVKQEVKMRKANCALLVGYNGTGYSGLQINPDVKTIENDLELAIYEAGFISSDNHENLKKVKWTRAARTDKGVHAISNVITLKMLLHDEDLENDFERQVREINGKLPSQIRLFGINKVTKNFNSKLQCTARQYEYVVPTYAFQPREEYEAYRAEQEAKGQVFKSREGDIRFVVPCIYLYCFWF